MKVDDSMIRETNSEEETYNLGIDIGKVLIKGSVICLNGDLGVGKTVFARGIIRALGITTHITSPTFMIVNEYIGIYKVYHFDVYRVHDIDELLDIGFLEYFTDGSIVIIEWADLIEEILPIDKINVNIYMDSQNCNKRKIEVLGLDHIKER